MELDDSFLSESNIYLDPVDRIYKNKKDIGKKIRFPKDGYDTCFNIEENSFWFKHRTQVLIAAIQQFPAQGPILDLGGGNGYVSKKLEDFGYSCILMEPGIKGCLNAKARGVSTIINSTLSEARLKDESISGIGIFDVLEHIEDKKTFLRQIYKVLAPTGHLYITVPAYKLLWSESDVKAEHTCRYTFNMIKKELNEAGFRIKYSTYFFQLLLGPIFLLRSIPYFLGLHRKNTDENDHQISKNNSKILSILKYEINCIKKGKRLPFGGSLLVVASKIKG